MRELMVVTARLDDLVDRIARVAKRIEDLRDRMPVDAGDPAPVRSRRASIEEHVLREEARVGASALEIRWDVDGSAGVRVNGGKTFRLRAKLARLLQIIAAQGGRVAVDDGLVGWRSYGEVAAALRTYPERDVSVHSVSCAIHRLRTAFREAGQNWFLIHTDRRGSARFALLREAAAALGPSGVGHRATEEP